MANQQNNNLKNVYFTASITGKKDFLENYLQIVGHLQKRNMKVLSDHILKSEHSQVIKETRKERLEFQSQLEKWINSADFVVAETSFPSISVGYEISLAIQKDKPVLILYRSETPPTLLQDHIQEKVACEQYDSSENLKMIIDDFINFVRGTNDSRFTFFITSEISTYLKKVSIKERVPKSVYLRQLIEKDMIEKGS